MSEFETGSSAAAALSLKARVAELGPSPARLFIGGRWVESIDGGHFEQVHPATNETVARIPIAGEADVDAGVRAARHAFDYGPWPTMNVRDRRAILRRFIDLAAKNADRITALQVLDNSNPVSIVGRSYLVSGHCVADVFEHHVGWIDKLNGEQYPSYGTAEQNLVCYSVREPVGVVAAITPWNSPVLLLCQKIAPALAAGCTVVIKPSENTNLATQYIVELLEQAGLPDGVVNYVTGPGNPTGEALINHPMVDKISFTGSRAVGERIRAAGSHRMTRLSLELGGKSPLIILPDVADARAAGAAAIAPVSVGMCGQTCAATTRIFAHKSIFDEVLAGAQDFVQAFRPGDPFDPATTSAPMITRTQQDRVMGFVERAVDAGAKVEFGIERSSGAHANGNWIHPGIVTGVDNRAEIAREEIFGPVLVLLPFDDLDEMVRLANESDYGLAARIATSNPGKGMALARRLRAGSVGINSYALTPHMPFGGFGASGMGREGGWEAICAYTETKAIIVNTA